LLGCWSTVAADSARRPVVIATVLPVYCVAANVAGDLAQVNCLLGEGGDAHDYQLTPRDRSNIERAEAILFNGLGLEPWLDKVIASVRSGRELVALSAGLENDLIPNVSGDRTPRGAHSHHDGAVANQRTGMNPHVWLDPILMARMATNALRAFQRMDPPNAAQYVSNCTAFVQRLLTLDRDLAEGLRPFQRISVVTYHDAFPYFARRYGLKVAGVIEEIPDVDPTPLHLSELRKTILDQQVKAIFVEPRHSARVARRMGRDMNVRVGVLDTLETGELGLDSYDRGMRANLQSIRKALE
jgi:zinc transport system substrate-binding protein